MRQPRDRQGSRSDPRRRFEMKENRPNSDISLETPQKPALTAVVTHLNFSCFTCPSIMLEEEATRPANLGNSPTETTSILENVLVSAAHYAHSWAPSNLLSSIIEIRLSSRMFPLP